LPSDKGLSADITNWQQLSAKIHMIHACSSISFHALSVEQCEGMERFKHLSMVYSTMQAARTVEGEAFRLISRTFFFAVGSDAYDLEPKE